MSTQDKLERVLRDIHVLISRSELYDNTGEKIIVEKKKMFEYLNHLNACRSGVGKLPACYSGN